VNHTPSFVWRDGLRYLGTHLLIDLRRADPELLASPVDVEHILRQAAAATGATILSGHFHHFGEGSGVTGVLILAESHISIHTWPEFEMAAVDIFVCGDCNPWRAEPVIREGFCAFTEVTERLRCDF
jgi:S-adenosylmethionine decarboxylase